jgi:hypothetical protein
VIVVASACSGGSDDGSATTGSGGDGGPVPAPAESKSDFCRVLDDGFSTLSQNAASAGQGGLDQFSLLVAQLGETSRLMARLADVAPDEIALDMKSAAKAWDDQMAAVGQGVGDPLGALGAIFVTSLTSSASLQAVDDWSLTNCGRTVFGITGTAAGTGT